MKKVYCGYSTIENINISEVTPVDNIKFAVIFIDTDTALTTFSNSPDFVSMCKYYAEAKGVDIEFYLNDKPQGSDIEKIFKYFNKSFKLMDKILRKAREIKWKDTGKK